MKLFLDSADLKQCRDICQMLPIEGITTNPTIIAKEKTEEIDLLFALRDLMREDKLLFAQVRGYHSDEFIEHALRLRENIPSLIIKVPITEQGLIAIKKLQQQNIPTLGTAIYSTSQGALAILAKTNYIAPYVNRIDNFSHNGIQVVKDLQTLINTYQSKTEILAASFKSVKQVIDCLLVGCCNVTVSPDIIKQILNNPIVFDALEKFEADYALI